MTALSTEALRRGWCPSTLRPMETGDGLLVRLHPPDGVLTPKQLARIAALAEEHGNGLVDISARANLQIRGVRHDTHPVLVDALLTGRLVEEHDGDGPQRLTLVSPLLACPPQTGDEMTIGSPLALAMLAKAIETAGRTIPGLPAKTLVAIDDGGPVSLDGFAADIRVRAIADDAMAIGLPNALWLGPVAGAQVADRVTRLLAGFAALHRREPETIRRLRDLAPDDLARLADAAGLARMTAPVMRAAPRRAGLFELAAGRCAAMIGLPFGRGDAATLKRLAGTADSLGASGIRLSPWRGLACHGLAPDAGGRLIGEAQALGLITRDDDPRLSVQACAGKPACSRAQTDTTADAAALAEAAGPLLATGATIHVSGCIKSCALAGASDLTLIGRDGGYDLVVAGTTRDRPIAALDLPAILARLRPGQDLFTRVNRRGPSGPWA